MATNYFEIPLTPSPQKFLITLVGVQYSMSLAWRIGDQGSWFLDISDASGNPIIQGIPLVTGINLLAQYDYLGFGFKLYVMTDGNTDLVPTFTNLGLQSHLLVGVPA